MPPRSIQFHCLMSASEPACYRFDLFGYGHGLFHIVMVVTSIFQYDASWFELQSRRRKVHPSTDATSAISQHAPAGGLRQPFPQPSCQLLICEFILMITACVIFVIFTHRVRRQRAQEILTSPSRKVATPGGATINHETTTSESDFANNLSCSSFIKND